MDLVSKIIGWVFDGFKIAVLGCVIYWLVTLDASAIQDVIIAILQLLWVM